MARDPNASYEGKNQRTPISIKQMQEQIKELQTQLNAAQETITQLNSDLTQRPKYIKISSMDSIQNLHNLCDLQVTHPVWIYSSVMSEVFGSVAYGSGIACKLTDSVVDVFVEGGVGNIYIIRVTSGTLGKPKKLNATEYTISS